MGLFKRYNCLTCGNIFKRDPDLSSHVMEQHLVREGEQFTFQCPCGVAGGRWPDTASALAARMGHMERDHGLAGWPRYEQ